jgi:two-component system sensor histidine kinase KdpD
MMKPARKQNGQTKKDFTGLLLGVGLLAVTTLLLKIFQFEQYLYNVALIFIIIVLLIASQYGLWPGLAVSILGFLCLNYFFIPPYYTFYIDSGAGVVAVLGFLIAAIITSQIAARARRKTEEAQLSQQETAALNQLNMAVLSTAKAESMLKQVVEQVNQHLEASATLLYLSRPDNPGLLEVQASHFEKPEVPTEEFFRHEIVQLTFQKKDATYVKLDNQGRIAYLPLVAGEEDLGVLAILLKDSIEVSSIKVGEVFRMEEQRWLQILANQTALAVDHARLIEETALITSLKEADRLKSVLLASVSHELRTPLTSIKTAIAGLKDESIELEPEEQREYLEVIDQEADRLTRLISNLLDLSRIEAGTLKPQKGLYSLPEIIGKTLERLARTEILTDHFVQTRFEEDLPLVPVDYLQIDQVMTNLIENAAKYSTPGKPINLKVSQAPKPLTTSGRRQSPKKIEGEVRPTGILVEVIDEGIGVPETELERIFDKFYRVEQSGLSYNVSGSGMGLAICKGIIEAHAGLIWARRRIYGGTIIAFWLPLALSPALPQEHENTPPK